MTDDRACIVQAHLPATNTSVGQARELIRGWIDSCGAGFDGQVDDIVLAVSEASANVVLHAYPTDPPDPDYDIEGHFEPHQLTIVIRDSGVGPHQPSPRAGLGQGLQLLERLSTSWQIQDTHPGTRVTLQFELPAPSATAG